MLANCNGVLDALGDGNPDWVGPPAACLVGLGCYVSSGTSRFPCNSADGAALRGTERACACQ